MVKRRIPGWTVGDNAAAYPRVSCSGSEQHPDYLGAIKGMCVVDDGAEETR